MTDPHVTNPGDITAQLHCCWREVDGVIEEAVAEVPYQVQPGDVVGDDEQGHWTIGRPPEAISRCRAEARSE